MLVHIFPDYFIRTFFSSLSSNAQLKEKMRWGIKSVALQLRIWPESFVMSSVLVASADSYPPRASTALKVEGAVLKLMLLKVPTSCCTKVAMKIDEAVISCRPCILGVLRCMEIRRWQCWSLLKLLLALMIQSTDVDLRPRNLLWLPGGKIETLQTWKKIT